MVIDDKRGRHTVLSVRVQRGNIEYRMMNDEWKKGVGLSPFAP
jgi:hypothetical protein